MHRAALLGKAGPRTSICCFVPSYFSRPGTIPSTYLRRGDWKLIYSEEQREAALYNLATDPGERHNLAKAKPDEAKRLRAKLAAWQKRMGAKMPTPNSDYESKAKRPVRKQKTK